MGVPISRGVEIPGTLSPFVATASARYAAANRDAAITRSPAASDDGPAQVADDADDLRPARLIDVYA